MADTPVKAGPTQLTTSAANILTAGAAGTIVRMIHVANTSTGTAAVSISVGSTGVDTAASRFQDALSIASHGSYDWSGFLFVPNGEYLTAKSDTSTALTITVSGVSL